jgi:hypothetical protein
MWETSRSSPDCSFQTLTSRVRYSHNTEKRSKTIHRTMIRINSRPDITGVKAILNDGTEIPLSQKRIGNTRKPSQCTFFGELTDGPFSITLRLDWSDKDTNGDPMLDADIYQKGKRFRVSEEKWHQTHKILDGSEWVYKFEFENIKLRFKVGTTSQRNQLGMSRIDPAAAPSVEVPNKDLRAPWAFGRKQVFCVACQAVTTQNFVVDRNNEILVTCDCGRHLKFPLTETEEQLSTLLAAHQKANQGRAS